jgi:glutathione synthase/RimK-type ligase-like ATP-grasp enzyme
MRVGLCNLMPDNWKAEFERSCQALGLEPVEIRIGRDDWMEQVRTVDLFVWRLVMSSPTSMVQARTKIPIIESMGIPCFPNARMLWLYDDKIRETFFLRQHGYPTPRTWVFFDRDEACGFAASASYPLVIKSHCGASSGGVQRLDTPAQAQSMLSRIFRKPGIWADVLENYYTLPRLRKGDLMAQLQATYLFSRPRYAYLQEFLTIERDWRITTLGADLVSVFCRKNRPGDFRASGSGIWEKVEAADLPEDACTLALEISNTHGFTSMTYDFMRRGESWVIGEMSYAFVLNAVYSDTLFSRTPAGFVKTAPRAIGEMHLEAMRASSAAGAAPAGSL